MHKNTTPTLPELPPPPPGKSGWPWTEEIQPIAKSKLNNADLPLISIVTPSYNYGHFIEETIRSVLLQGYPNLEYIIIDGGSTDNTVEIIQKYENYLTYWVSEPDKGQTDAINKGYQHCNGQIFAWLNADDAYLSPYCLREVSQLYSQGYNFIVGECIYENLTQDQVNIDSFKGKSTPTNFTRYLKFWLGNFLPQPSVFLAKSLADQGFPLDLSLYFVMDYQFFLRALSQKPKTIWVNKKWVKASLHGDNKTMLSPTKRKSELLEFSQVSLAESNQLPLIFCQIIQSDIKDYLLLRELLDTELIPTFEQVIVLLRNRPTLLRWILVWKILLKSLVGSVTYSKLKSLAQIGK
jgi:glycosyltransferase involved in cell wall biosynthesis